MMERFRILAVTLSFLVLVAMLVGCAGPKTVGLFPDENLEAAIRDALGKPPGEEITAAELAKLTTLKAESSGISDLSGLEYCTNLTELSLWENEISDISSLAPLTNLTVLYLYGNQIGDISSLASLTNLTMLFLEGNQISDISPLVENSGLGEGDEIWLDGNKLELWEGSEDMENIRALEDRGVAVTY